MQNFGQYNINSLLKELSGASAELGEAFAAEIDNMVYQTGITNPKAASYQVVSESWKKLVKKPDKTPEDIKEIENRIKTEFHNLAISYLLYMAKETKNLTGKLDYLQYEAYLIKHRFSRYSLTHNLDYMTKIKKQIRNAFNKVSSHGEPQGDNLIDKDDMAAYLYALCTKAAHNENGEFIGFENNGTFTPEEYAISESQLFEEDDNLFSVKLRTAYKVLNNKF